MSGKATHDKEVAPMSKAAQSALAHEDLARCWQATRW